MRWFLKRFGYVRELEAACREAKIEADELYRFCEWFKKEREG